MSFVHSTYCSSSVARVAPISTPPLTHRLHSGGGVKMVARPHTDNLTPRRPMERGSFIWDDINVCVAPGVIRRLWDTHACTRFARGVRLWARYNLKCHEVFTWLRHLFCATWYQIMRSSTGRPWGLTFKKVIEYELAAALCSEWQGEGQFHRHRWNLLHLPDLRVWLNRGFCPMSFQWWIKGISPCLGWKKHLNSASAQMLVTLTLTQKTYEQIQRWTAPITLSYIITLISQDCAELREDTWREGDVISKPIKMLEEERNHPWRPMLMCTETKGPRLEGLI